MRKIKGISLIVLVITIIVMIILAGSIILTLSNNGIIGKASDAVEKSDETTVNQIAQMAWAEAYAKNITSKNKLTGDKLIDYLEEEVKKALEDNGLSRNDYGVIASTKGVEIGKGWLQSGTVVIKGDTKLQVGDDITYDETVSGEITKDSEYDVDWKILGANKKGELLIISDSNKTSNNCGMWMPDLPLADLQNNWITSEEWLSLQVAKYGKGKSATGARSMLEEDIDRILQQDKRLYGKGKIDEYGNVVTYSYDGSKIKYTSTNGANGEFDVPTDGFHYYNGTEFIKADLSNGPCEIAKITSDYYHYSKDDFDKIAKTKAYTILSVGDEWWLATPYSKATENGFEYGVQAFDGVKKASFGIAAWYSYGYTSNGDSDTNRVRAVVSLSPTVNLVGSSDEGWTY